MLERQQSSRTKTKNKETHILLVEVCSLEEITRNFYV
jgi:hypothetical protein